MYIFYESRVFLLLAQKHTHPLPRREAHPSRQALPPHESAAPASCPERRGRTHFGTEVASLVVVASFPKTSSMMCSSGAAGTGSSGGTSVMISATCSVRTERDRPSQLAGDRAQPAKVARPGHRSRARLTWLTRERKTILEPIRLSVYVKNQNGILIFFL